MTFEELLNKLEVFLKDKYKTHDSFTTIRKNREKKFSSWSCINKNYNKVERIWRDYACKQSLSIQYDSLYKTISICKNGVIIKNERIFEEVLHLIKLLEKERV